MNTNPDGVNENSLLENHSVFADAVTRKFLAQHTVTVVPSLRAAQQTLSAAKFDLRLVHYDLDDGKGDALIREIQGSSEPITVIGVSSHDEGNAALRRAGARAICSKMQFNQIQSVIEKVVERPNGGWE